MAGILEHFLRVLVEGIALAIIAKFFSAIDPSMEMDQHNSSSVKDTTGPYMVQTNHLNGRLEGLVALIDPKVLLDLHLTNEEKRQVQKSSGADDVLGVLIHEKLGGSPNKTFNVVPMNPSTYEIWKTKVIEPTYNYVKPRISNGNHTTFVSFTVIPFYGDKNATRPNSFLVAILAFDTSQQRISYVTKGFVPNPLKAGKSTGLVPYLYETGQITPQGNENCQYFTVKAGEKQLEDRVEMITLIWGERAPSCKKIEGNKTNEVQRRNNDVQGVLISEKFGGRQEDPFNAVPMDPTAVSELKARMELPISDHIESNKNSKDPGFWLNIMLIYADSLATRPEGFVVRCSVKTGRLFDPMYIPNNKPIN